MAVRTVRTMRIRFLLSGKWVFLVFSYELQWLVLSLSLPLSLPLSQLREYKVVGRRVPTEKDLSPPLYRMRVFAPDPVSARSRYWYFIKRLKKIKKTNGEICYCGVVSVKSAVHVTHKFSPFCSVWKLYFFTHTHTHTHTSSAGERQVAHENQERGYLAEVRLSEWDPQHVQRVPRSDSGWCCHTVL